MSLIRKILGKDEREKDRKERSKDTIEGYKSKSIFAAKKFAAEAGQAFDIFETIDELLSSPKVEFSKEHHTKLIIPPELSGLNEGLVIIFSACDDPKPICAWYETLEDLNTKD